MGFLRSFFNLAPEPDFYFAAKGYVLVAVMRREGRDPDFLRKLAWGHGRELLSDGCTPDQANSTFWGGYLAMEDDGVLYDLAIQKGRAEAKEMGLFLEGNLEGAKDVFRSIQQRSADFVVRCAWEEDHSSYRRFLRAIKPLSA